MTRQRVLVVGLASWALQLACLAVVEVLAWTHTALLVAVLGWTAFIDAGWAVDLCWLLWALEGVLYVRWCQNWRRSPSSRRKELR